MATPRYDADALRDYADQLLQAAGMESDKAATVADILVEGDLLGHDTHGLALLAPYIAQIENLGMTVSGSPQVLSDRGAALLWDGRRLPGPWLVRHGIETLAPRARQYGTASLVIQRSHHIACLAAYLLQATDSGLLITLASSDPASASVAPHGGTKAVFTPNPVAMGIPTSTTPFLVDISASIVTNGMSTRLDKAGRQFDHECLYDAQGNPTADPRVLSADPPGTVMPLGGPRSGHKGYGLALMVEAMTAGLAGYGRADPPEGWGATVFLGLHDPAAFGGTDAFARQMDHIGDACRSSPPRPGGDPVRLPGDRGLALRQEQLGKGVALHPTIPEALAACGKRYGVGFPPAR